MNSFYQIRAITVIMIILFLSTYIFAGWEESEISLENYADSNDYFGCSVSISNDVGIVGAYGDDGDMGSAYIHYKYGNQWSRQKRLTASDRYAGDKFGSSVAIYGNYAVVGAPGDDNSAGSAYVFLLNENGWNQVQKLTAPARESEDKFGTSIAINGHYIVVGAPFSTSKNGAVFTYKLNNSNWEYQSKIMASDGGQFDAFGESISISGNDLVVGASKNDDRGADSGSAYVFRFDGINWVQEANLLASDGLAYNYFGFSVSIDNTTILVGAYGKNTYAGAAYIFEKIDNVWVQKKIVQKPNPAAYEFFGCSVSLSGYNFAVGAYAVYGLTGAVYTYHKEDGIWNYLDYTMDYNRKPGDRLGSVICLKGDQLLCGAYADDEFGSDSGSASSFYFNGQSWIQQRKLFSADVASYNSEYELNPIEINDNLLVIGEPNLYGHGVDGVVNIYNKINNDWVFDSQLVSPKYIPYIPGEKFGANISTDGEYIAVGTCDYDYVYLFKKSNNIWKLQQTIFNENDDLYFGGRLLVKNNKLIISTSLNHLSNNKMFRITTYDLTNNLCVKESDFTFLTSSLHSYSPKVTLLNDYYIVHDFGAHIYVFKKQDNSFTLVQTISGTTFSYSDENSILTVLDGIVSVYKNQDNIFVKTHEYPGNFKVAAVSNSYIAHLENIISECDRLSLFNFDEGRYMQCKYVEFPNLFSTTTYIKQNSFVIDNNTIVFSNPGKIKFVKIPTNTPPSSSDFTKTIVEDGLFTLNATDISFDSDDPTETMHFIKIVGFYKDGTLFFDQNGNDIAENDEQIQIDQVIWKEDLSKIKFKPTANVYGNGKLSLYYKVNDGIDYSTEFNTLTVNVSPVNDLLVINNFDPNPIGCLENHIYGFSGTVNIINNDDPNLLGMNVVIDGYMNGEDELYYNIPPSSGIVLSQVNGTFTFSGSSNYSNYLTLVRSLGFINNSDTPTTTPRTVRITINNESGSSNELSRPIVVIAVNDKPILSEIEASNISYTENQDATIISSTLKITDVDDTSIESATISIASNFVTGEDILQFQDQNGITGNYDNETGILGLSGSSSKENYLSALRSIKYYNTSDNPEDLDRTISFVIFDGDSSSLAISRIIEITPVNDKPIITNFASKSFLEEQSFSISISDLTIIDPDNSNPLDFSMIILSGENYSLNNQQIVPNIDFFGNLDVNVKVNDGVIDSEIYNYTIEILPINDPPVNTIVPSINPNGSIRIGGTLKGDKGLWNDDKDIQVK
ncbi:MAG: hypothetical protein JXR48_13505 [Candidatus Delongbacteria bacterium]|nr:hypothetical protein [Candidatus Delongbacteria bacterium]MBN2835972.1 hypothetical protein [Candidatus Delongbacteria bacterium]